MGEINATVLADSVANSVRLVTVLLHLPRFILAELNTHRVFSRNSASSRAIPLSRTIAQVEDDPVFPVSWGKNRPGMVAEEDLGEEEGLDATHVWTYSSYQAATAARSLRDLGVHKQVANRVLEPFIWVDSLVTSTEWDNFFKLRMAADAQPEMRALATALFSALLKSKPRPLAPGERHLPYVSLAPGEAQTADHIRSSVARCARVSYSNHDGTTADPERDRALYERLLSAGHLSPFEHQATPMEYPRGEDYLCEGGSLPWESGATHMDRRGDMWSGNFRGWIQFRQVVTQQARYT